VPGLTVSVPGEQIKCPCQACPFTVCKKIALRKIIFEDILLHGTPRQ
jgi:hypothetical protein